MSSYGYWMRRRCREVKLQWVDDKKNMNKADWLWQHTSPEEYYFSRRVCVRHMYIISCHETNMGESVAILLLAIRVFRWGVFLYFQKIVHIDIYAAARLYVRRIFFFFVCSFYRLFRNTGGSCARRYECNMSACVCVRVSVVCCSHCTR